jgi:hypothetical protein
MSIEAEPQASSSSTALSKEPKLIPVLSSRWALRGAHVAVVGLFCALFTLLNHLPLRNTDLWGHVVFGRAVLDQHAIPTVDPLLPLAEGMRIVDVHWLSQTIFAAVDRWGGPEALVGLFTLVVWSTYVLLGRTFYLQTKSLGLTTLLTLAVVLVGWSRIATIRPENFAMLLFAVLLWMQFGRRARRAESVLADDTRGDALLWVGIPLVAGLWANLHGSFPIVVGTLGCFWFGRVVEVAWHERSFKAVFTDREMRRQLYWLELAFAATLVNPYGIDAWIEAVRFSSNLNLREIVEWSPLVVIGIGGREFAVACVVLAVVLRHSRKAMNPVDVLLLALFGFAAVMQIRMSGWFAAVWGVTIAPHLADVVGRWFQRAEPVALVDEEEIDTTDYRTPALRYRNTLLCIVMIWLTFAFSTFSRPLLGGAPRPQESLLGDTTPIRAGDFLKASKLSGLAFNPQHWGDWLGMNAPSGLKMFATTNIHLMPRNVWLDYLRVLRGDTGWDSTLDKYNVRVLIVDKKDQATLLHALKTAPDWVRVFEDDQAMILRRKSTKPAETQPAASTAAAHP